jgi:hypothetical protein
MRTQIFRIGDALFVEISEELMIRAGLTVGEPLEWVPNEYGGLNLVKASTIQVETS